jgi:hypothetical protein
MALVNIDSVLPNLLQKLDKLRPPQGMELLSYKRNRSIAVLLCDNGRILVREKGYRLAEHMVEKAKLPRHLKSLIKYEFPRSRKLRMYQIDTPEDLERPLKKL